MRYGYSNYTGISSTMTPVNNFTTACTVSKVFWMDVTRILLGAHYQFIRCHLMPIDEENQNNKSIVELYYCCLSLIDQQSAVSVSVTNQTAKQQ